MLIACISSRTSLPHPELVANRDPHEGSLEAGLPDDLKDTPVSFSQNPGANDQVDVGVHDAFGRIVVVG